MSKWSPFGNFKPGDLRVLGLGLELAVAIGGLGMLGHLGDLRWQTDPWLTLTGIALGTVGGCWNVYQSAKKDGLLGPKQGRSKKHPQTHQQTREADKKMAGDTPPPDALPPSSDSDTPSSPS